MPPERKADEANDPLEAASHPIGERIMTSILGIDTAWTEKEPSGIALVSEVSEKWQVLAAAPSYEIFLETARGRDVNWTRGRIQGGPPDISSLLAAAEKLSGERVQIVALDMPLASVPFAERRAADNEVSREFGGRWCATHSPTLQRPGPLGRHISTALGRAGYELAVDPAVKPGSRYYLEVYPHVALLSLLQRERRVPYKVSKTKKYWPGTNLPQRKANLLQELQAIYRGLEAIFGKLPFALSKIREAPSLASLKRYEDVLDALVCAWVGIRFAAGETLPLGDATAAVWCPKDIVRSKTRKERE